MSGEPEGAIGWGSAPLDVIYDIIFFRVTGLFREESGKLVELTAKRKAVQGCSFGEYDLESESTYHLRPATHLAARIPAHLPGNGRAKLKLVFDPNVIAPLSANHGHTHDCYKHRSKRPSVCGLRPLARITGRRLFLYMQKTGEPVNVILPDFVLKVLEETPRVTDRHFFWSGQGKLDSIVRSWQARLCRLFGLAEIPNGHPHRLRDTFAVELLLAGVPIERVSVLLGHTNVRITERHPWNKARQEQLEADLTRAWEQDPLVKAQSQTPPLVGHMVHDRYTERKARA